MARFDDIYERYKKKRQNGTGLSGAGDLTSGAATDFSTYTGTGRFAGILANARKNGVSFSGVDESYVQSFLKDAQDFSKKSYEESRSLTWAGATSQEQYDSRVKTMQELGTRADAVRVYLNSNKGKINQEWYDYLTSFLDDFEESRQAIFDTFHGAKEYYSQWGSQEAYDSYETARATYDEKSKADLSKLTAELGNMEAQVEQARQIRAQIGAFNPFAYSDSTSAAAAEKELKDKLAKITAPWGGMEGMEAAYSEKQQYYTTAKRIQDGKKLEEAANNEDFAAMSGYQSTELDNWLEKVFSQYGLGYGDVTHEYINADQKRREELLREYSKFAGEQTDLDKYLVFDNMTGTEIGIYNYYYNKEGKEKAQEYLDHLAESLNYRMAEQSYSRYQGNTLAEILLGIEVGADQFRAGMKGLWNSVTGNEEYIPATTTQILGGFVRKDLENSGWNLPEWAGGASLGQMAYDLLSTTTNMVPSLAVSGVVGMVNPTAGAAVGAGLLGASAAGNAYTEMINQGFSKQQARTYSALVGSSEAGLSYLLGGIGMLGGKLSGNAIGKIVSKVDNIFGKVAVKLGGTMLSEGMEEGLQEVLTPWFKQIATNIEQDVNWEEVAYSSLLGSLSGLLMEGPGAVQSARSGTNAPAPLTENEKAVVEKVYKDRIAEEGKDGKKVTKKRQTEIYEQVLKDLENGSISTDTIEEVLGGEQYKGYREAYDKEENRRKALEAELEKLTDAPNTVGNAKRYDQVASELEQLKKDTSLREQKTALGQTVSEMVRSDRLSESYAEKGRKSEAFQADLTRYSEKQKATVQAAIDSGVLNNTKKTHDFVDMMAKIYGDKGVVFQFADNKRLQEMGYYLPDVTVNGVTTGEGIILNMNSGKLLNRVVGHEITHVLEGSPELYNAMADTILELARTKGEYDSRLAQITKLYEGREGYTGEDANAKLQKELVADLVGDYLFSDEGFVKKLSAENRNLFQKLWDEVKYLCRVVTAGSKEARQLEAVKKRFEAVYRAETKNPTGDGGVRYSINAITDANGKSYGVGVHLDSTLLDNLTEKERVGMVKEYVKELGGESFTAYDPNGNAVNITIAKANARFRNQSGKKVSANKDLTTKHINNEVKQEAVVLLDELVTTSQFQGDSTARHKHGWLDNDGQNNWDIWTTYIQDRNGTIWEATLNVANSTNGEKILYDISPIKKVGQSGKSDTIPTKDSIRDSDGKVNSKNSLSEKAAEDIAPMPWEIRGKDVSLEGVDLPMPEDIARMEAGEGVRQVREQPGEAVGTEDYEGEEDYEETVEDRLEIRKRRLQYEVRQNQAHREEVTQRLEAEIAALREEYDGLQNKNTKKANQLLRRINNKSGQLMQRQAEYDKSIRDLQERIAKVEEKLQQDHTKENRLEKIHRKIDEEYQQAEMELAKEYYKNRYPLATELENRGKWLSDMAFDLYEEMVAHNKGETLSPRLKELTRTGKDWQEIKYALEDIKDSPEALSRNPTDTEMLVREILEKKYDTKRKQLTAMEEDFNKKLTELEKEREAKKKKTTVAGKRKESRSKYLYEVAKIVGDISGWKDLPTGLHYKTQTLQRYLGDVVRTPEGKQDLETAKALYEYTQGSYNHNEADMKRELNALFDKYREMEINKEESAYIQILGEVLQGTGDGVKTKVTERDAKMYLEAHRDKIDEQKCRKVIEMARKDYDEVWARMNEVLREHGMEEVRYVQGYFPHFEDPPPKWWHKVFNIQPIKPQTELQQIRREAADATKTEVAGHTGSFKPNKKSQSYTKMRTGPTTDFNFLKGYETYMAGALDWIYHIPDIQRMRALENYIRIQSAKNNEVMARKIKEIQESDAYNADEEQLQLDLIFQQDKYNKLSNLVIDLMNRTNNLAGKRTGGDRTVEELLNPDAAKGLQQISGRNAANLVAGSISAASSNFLALTRAIGGTSLRGMGSAIWDYTFHNKEVDAVDKSDFLTNRLRNPDKLQKGFWDKTSDVVGWLGEWTDGLTSRVIWDARYKDNVQMGMSAEAAIKDADDFAESVLAGRSRGNKPTLFNSNNIVTKVFTTCQLEVANDYGFLFKDLPRDQRIGKTNRLAAAYTKIAIGTFLLTELFYEPLTGRSPGFDPLGMVLDLIFGLADDEEEPKDAVLDFLEEGLQNVPFIGGLMGGGRVPLSSALPYDGNILDAAAGITKAFAEPDWKNVFHSISKGDWEGVAKEGQKGDWMGLLDEMSNPLYYLVPPMGGGQIRKTAQGLGMYFNEVPGSYTADGELRYPVEEGIAPWLQAALFGKWSGQNAQQYIDEGRKPLSAKQTREFFESGMTIQEYWGYRDEMTKLKKQDEKLSFINGMDITDEQKKVLKRYLFDEAGYAQDNPEKYAFLEEEGIGYLGWKELPDDVQQAWSWAFKHQDEYRHYKENGVMPGDYTTYQVPFLDFKDEANQAYEWEYDYPEKAVMGKAFNGGVVEYRKHTKAISELKGDKDKNGKEISGSRKQKVTDYINGLDLDYGEKIILYVSAYSNTASRDAYGYDIVEYLNNRGDLSTKQIGAILEELGFTVSEDGRVTWD